MSDILSVQEVFAYLERFTLSGRTLPEGYTLDVRVAPGFGPPDDLIVQVTGGDSPTSVAFSTTVMRPPHTRDTVDATITQLVSNVCRRLNAGSN